MIWKKFIFEIILNFYQHMWNLDTKIYFFKIDFCQNNNRIKLWNNICPKINNSKIKLISQASMCHNPNSRGGFNSCTCKLKWTLIIY